MPTTDPIEILLAHDRWATLQILSACEKLTPAQFAQPFDMGPGSLQATLTHMIAAMNTWSDTLAQRPLGPRIDQPGNSFSPAQLIPLHQSATAAFLQLARNHPPHEQVTRVREGKTFSFPRITIITHVATHGMHHRAQCLNMLKHLQVRPLPPSSIAEWSRLVDAA